MSMLASDARWSNLYLDTQNVYIEHDRYKPYVSMNGRYVKISITDTGVGMDEKQKKGYLNLFHHKEMGRGSGLGWLQSMASLKTIMDSSMFIPKRTRPPLMFICLYQGKRNILPKIN